MQTIAMSCRSLLTKISTHQNIENFLRNFIRNSASTVLPHHEDSHKLATPSLRRQVVLKNVESLEHGRKMIQIYPPPSRMESQSVLLPGAERIRASRATDTPETFLEFPDPNTRFVGDTLTSGMQLTSDGECIGYRSPPKTGKYKWMSYSEVQEKSRQIGSGLIKLGIKPSQKSLIGICTKTRPEFILTMFGCAEYSMVLVPLYQCFGHQVLTHIIQEVEMEALIVEDSDTARELIKNSEKFPNLKYIILIDNDISSSDVIRETKESRIQVMNLQDLQELGKSNMHPTNKPKPDDLFCIIYTSGTTGLPKGVMITHKNLLASISALNTHVGDTAPMKGRVMCYLPCAHIYEIVNEVLTIYKGGQLGFYSGSIETLLSDITELRPNVLPLVPKLMNLIYSGAKRKIGPNLLRRYLLKLSLAQNEKKLKKGVIDRTAIWDRLVLSKIQKVLGGNIQIILSSSAPVSKEVMYFVRCAMGCLVFEAYGLSEVGAAAMTLIAEHDAGFVGPPLPCNHIKLVDVPELSYFAKEDVGEICIQGANVFQGYYKNPEATAEAFDKDGWYHTGDIGKWLSNGALSIIDRKKHIFKMSQGEYIVPEKMEGIYIQSHIISQVFVEGHSNQDFAVAIVVPDKTPFIKWASEEGFKSTDLKELCQDQAVKKAVLIHMIKLGKRKGLISLHQVGNIHVSPEPFSQENDLLTPTLKMKRSVGRKVFQAELRNLYKEGNLKKALDL